MSFQSYMAKEYYNITSRAIRKMVRNSEEIASNRYKIDSYILLDLDRLLNEVYCSIRPVSADYATRNEMVKCLNNMAFEIYGNSKENSPVLEAYGSFVMDMFSSQSDLDVSINLGIGFYELPRQMKLQILKRFANKLHFCEGKGIVRNVESIFTARVPIVKFSDEGTNIECDLSVENKGGILNSQIIRIISQIDERFQKLCMLVKRWAKANGVNSALKRTLNSLSITLLVAHHLQTQTPPILPAFSVLFSDGMDPSNVEKRIQRNFLNWGSNNKESLGKLFATFFIKFQSVEILWKRGLCVSVLNGLWISHKWKKTNVAISIEDFTDVSQNVARRVNGQGAKKIYSSINRTVDDIFEFLNRQITETDLIQRLFGQQAVMARFPPVPQVNGTHVKHGLLSQHAVIKPPPHVPRVNGKIAGTHLKHGLFGQYAVMEPPPVPPLNGNFAGTDLRHLLIAKQARLEPPPVPPLNGNIAETHVRQAVVEPLPPVLPLNGNFAGTHVAQAVVEPPPPVLPFNVYQQQPHNSYRNGFTGLAEEHPSKRVRLGTGYRAVEGTGQGREEERYEDLNGKRNRYFRNYNGFEEYHETPWFGIHNYPHRQVPYYGRPSGNLVYHRHAPKFSGEEPMPVGQWQNYSSRVGPPPPQPPPPYGTVSYENFGPQNNPQPYRRSFYE